MCNNYVEFQLNKFSYLAVLKGHTYINTYEKKIITLLCINNTDRSII